MSDFLKKFLLDLVVGLVIVLILCWTGGIFGADSGTADTIRILCDGFFVAAALLIGGAGLQWTYNGGVMDGLTFAFKVGMARMKRDYEGARKTFAEYREEREAKATTPLCMLAAGACYLVPAVILYLVYTNIR